jgi:hypothetical protein
MSIALSIGNNLTTGGVFTADAVNNTSVTNVTDFASVPGGGALKLLSTQTASASATIDFTTGIDSTYDYYVFKFIDIHGSADDTFFQVNFRDGGASFDATKTTTVFRAYHFENGSGGVLQYETDHDLAQSTGVQKLAQGCGSDNDQNTVGTLHLFNPSNTTFVKHFISKTSTIHGGNDAAYTWNVAGYCNTTSAIDGAQFSMSSGNIDDGIIKMYGVV